ncbi:MAG TPA: tRNA pseudouridine(55) synthase TruB [Steroidobacteraceae bacterium]|nr:tRNA pseudouridine(55) synthase TruB [Steroidobacteraceae bacterium]
MSHAAAAGSPPAQRRWRTVDGIVLLDKPRGLSSTQALQRVRRVLQAAKAGHAGTLDPMATGMLPLCFGQATKACGQLLGQRKAYQATVCLGSATDTGDAEGRIVEQRDVPRWSDATLDRVLASLRGDRRQVPPMYSALKRDGRPLYELARRGETVARESRPVSIDRLQVTAATARSLELEVVCSKGTYVRVLAEEIAAGLGTVGHLGALRRLWVEPFAPDRMVTFEGIEAAARDGQGAPDWLLPVDEAFRGLPELRLDTTQSLHLRQGRTLDPPVGSAAGSLLRAYDDEHGFLGLVEIDATGRLRVQRLFVAGAGTAPAGPKT